MDSLYFGAICPLQDDSESGTGTARSDVSKDNAPALGRDGRHRRSRAIGYSFTVGGLDDEPVAIGRYIVGSSVERNRYRRPYPIARTGYIRRVTQTNTNSFFIDVRRCCSPGRRYASQAKKQQTRQQYTIPQRP